MIHWQRDCPAQAKKGRDRRDRAANKSIKVIQERKYSPRKLKLSWTMGGFPSINTVLSHSAFPLLLNMRVWAQQTCGQGEHGTIDVWARRT